MLDPRLERKGSSENLITHAHDVELPAISGVKNVTVSCERVEMVEPEVARALGNVDLSLINLVDLKMEFVVASHEVRGRDNVRANIVLDELVSVLVH